MSFETDLLIDRRRLKRRLFVWRAVAICAAIAAVLIALGRSGFVARGPHLARVDVTGLITEDQRLVDRIDALARDRSVPAVILSIDSPGGSVAGGETLHDAIARLARAKPVVTVMGGLAASAGYMIALPSTRIFAREATLTGSIGVLLETAEFSGLLGKIGVSPETIVSGPLKDQPGLTHPTSPEGRQVLQGIVMDMYGQFVDMVASGRHMDAAHVRELADGRPYTGRQALKLGLIDEIGGEREARDWLAREKHVPASLPVRDVGRRGWAGGLVGSTLGPVLGDLLKTVFAQRLTLDAPLALWQPPAPFGAAGGLSDAPSAPSGE
jgi:protease IV